jgi:hypothetical protein
MFGDRINKRFFISLRQRCGWWRMTAPRPLRRRTPAVATSLAARGPTNWASFRSAAQGVQRAGRGTAWQLRGLVQVCHHRGASVEPGGSSFERRASFWQGIVFVRRGIAPHHPAAPAGPRPAPPGKHPLSSALARSGPPPPSPTATRARRSPAYPLLTLAATVGPVRHGAPLPHPTAGGPSPPSATLSSRGEERVNGRANPCGRAPVAAPGDSDPQPHAR